MNEWINVNEKLPEKGISVLACAVHKISKYIEDSPITSSMYVAWIKNYGKEGKPIWQYSSCCGCYCGKEITHWMPLLKPPEAE